MAREVRLTKDMVALVDDEDYESVAASNWHASRSKDKWYAARSLPWRKVKGIWRRPKLYLHRFITGCDDPELLVDHFNGDTMDCTRLNLVVCDLHWNNHNVIVSRPTVTGYRGVKMHREGVYRAHIGYKGEDIHLGNFRDPAEAARAYDRKALELFGEFARTNAREGRFKNEPAFAPMPAQPQVRVMADVPF